MEEGEGGPENLLAGNRWRRGCVEHLNAGIDAKVADFSAFWRTGCAASILNDECLRWVYYSLVKHRAVIADQVSIRPGFNPDEFGRFSDSIIDVVEWTSENDIREAIGKFLNAGQAWRQVRKRNQNLDPGI